MGWATTSALGGWPLVRSPSVMDELRELSPTGGGSATCVDLSGRPQGSYDSAVSPYSRSAFGPVPLSRSDGGGGVYLESYTREARFLTRWDQHAVAQRRP